MIRKSSTETTRAERCCREVLGLEDFSDADIEAVRRAEPSQDAEAFNYELKR